MIAKGDKMIFAHDDPRLWMDDVEFESYFTPAEVYEIRRLEEKKRISHEKHITTVLLLIEIISGIGYLVASIVRIILCLQLS